MSETAAAARISSPWTAQALRFGRSLIVGGGGTTLDFLAVLLSLRVLGLDATWARVIGLCAGCVVMFFGSRSFAFRAQSESAVKQAKRFVISEAIAFPLNLVVFRLLLVALPSVPPEALSVLANFLLFVTYYYPVRALIVFKTKDPLVVQVVRA